MSKLSYRAVAYRVMDLAYAHKRDKFERAVATLVKQQRIPILTQLSDIYRRIERSGATMKPPGWCGEILRRNQVI